MGMLLKLIFGAIKGLLGAFEEDFVGFEGACFRDSIVCIEEGPFWILSLLKLYRFTCKKSHNRIHLMRLKYYCDKYSNNNSLIFLRPKPSG